MSEPESHPWTRLIGTWTIEAEHRLIPGEAIRGEVSFEWLDDQQCLFARWRYDHPKIPNALAVIGLVDGEPTMHYFDARGVHRVFEVGVTGDVWWYRNEVPGFSQRFRGTFSGDGDRIDGTNELCTDGVNWMGDMPVVYRKRR